MDPPTETSDASSLEAAMRALVEKYGAAACEDTLRRVVVHPSASATSSTSAVQLERAMLDSSFDSMFAINQSGVIQTVNTAALREFGFKEGELLGQNISVIVAGGHAKHHDRYLENYRKTREKRLIGTQRELTARRKDGSEFPCILGLQVIETGGDEEGLYYFASLRDITQEKKVRELLALNEREKHTKDMILQVAFNSFVTTDTKGTILYVNKAALTVFGYDSEDEMVGQNIKMIVGGGHDANHDGYMSEFLRTRVKHIIGSQREVPARRKDGSEFPAILGIQFIEQDGADSFFVAFVRDISHEKHELELEVEKRAAEELLLNMLPPEIALRLKENPTYLADHHASATVLFADIVGFTSLASELTPLEVVQLLNDLFSRFDDLVDKYQLNKVKTIGDCYMVTSIPGEDVDSVQKCTAVCHFAFDMIEAIQQYCLDNPNRPLSMRVGLNSGPVVAGIVGTKRFLYDIWGDAVNLASRMESTGVPGRIQVTAAVVENLQKDEFTFEARGEIKVKGKGQMETFFLTERLKDYGAL